MRDGNKVVLIAAALFAIFHQFHAYFYFDRSTLLPSIIFPVLSFVVTWIVGIVFTGIIAWIVVRAKKGTDSSD